MDLLDLYRRACRNAERVEFINPSVDAYHHAEGVLGVPVTQFEDLAPWVSVSEVS